MYLILTRQKKKYIYVIKEKQVQKGNLHIMICTINKRTKQLIFVKSKEALYSAGKNKFKLEKLLLIGFDFSQVYFHGSTTELLPECNTTRHFLNTN